MGISEHEMYPDCLVYDEIVRRRESREWKPLPLELPLYQPYWPDPDSGVGADEEEKRNSETGVLIIDLIDYTEIAP